MEGGGEGLGGGPGFCFSWFCGCGGCVGLSVALLGGALSPRALPAAVVSRRQVHADDAREAFDAYIAKLKEKERRRRVRALICVCVCVLVCVPCGLFWCMSGWLLGLCVPALGRAHLRQSRSTSAYRGGDQGRGVCVCAYACACAIASEKALGRWICP